MPLPTSLQRVALVTGSGKKRVGWHVADALAGRGYHLAVHYRTSAKEAAESVEHLRGRGVEAMAFQADVADEQAMSIPKTPSAHELTRIPFSQECLVRLEAPNLGTEFRRSPMAPLNMNGADKKQFA